MQVISIGNPICQLAECPLWNNQEKALYWTDILGRRIWKYHPQTEAIDLAWQGDLMVGGFAFTPTQDMVLCTDQGVHYLARRGGQDEQELSLLYDLDLAPDLHPHRFLVGGLTGICLIRNDGLTHRKPDESAPRGRHSRKGRQYGQESQVHQENRARQAGAHRQMSDRHRRVRRNHRRRPAPGEADPGLRQRRLRQDTFRPGVPGQRSHPFR